MVTVRIGTEAYGDLLAWATVHHRPFVHDEQANTLTVWI